MKSAKSYILFWSSLGPVEKEVSVGSDMLKAPALKPPAVKLPSHRALIPRNLDDDLEKNILVHICCNLLHLLHL